MPAYSKHDVLANCDMRVLRCLDTADLPPLDIHQPTEPPHIGRSFHRPARGAARDGATSDEDWSEGATAEDAERSMQMLASSLLLTLAVFLVLCSVGLGYLLAWFEDLA